MLSRGNSNASARVRRAKSTQSIKPRRFPLGITRVDAETARRHAIAAASEAFDRANRRTVLGPVDATRAADTHQKSIWRNESVRFTGPTAVRLDQRPITRTTVAPQAPVSGSGHSQTVSEGSHVSQYPDPFVTALPQVESIPSTPSSYRKLKKAKSMVTTQRLVVKLVAIRLLTEVAMLHDRADHQIALCTTSSEHQTHLGRRLLCQYTIPIYPLFDHKSTTMMLQYTRLERRS